MVAKLRATNSVRTANMILIIPANQILNVPGKKEEIV